jgi:integrase
MHLGRRAEAWRIHSLRHTIATHLRESLGVARDIVALILGHTQGGPAATRFYDRSELLAERRYALQRWADWLDGL